MRFLFILGALVGCAAHTSSWVHSSQVDPSSTPISVQQFDNDHKECIAVAKTFPVSKDAIMSETVIRRVLLLMCMQERGYRLLEDLE